MKLKTAIAALGAVAIFAIPATTMAAPPQGTLAQAQELKANKGENADAPNQVAQYSSRVIQNGQWVSGHNDLAGNPVYPWASESPSKGARADYVQELLGH
jgi:hypothetical protein